MIVIAIIGILAAALFPSITQYIERGRDASRTAHLRDIWNALGAFYADNERYATSTSGGCISSGSMSSNYLPVFFVDPVSGRNNGCGANGVYGYASGTGYSSAPQYVVTANFENDFGGNYWMGTGWALINLIGTGEFTFAERTAIDVVGVVRKGNGSGYLLYK